MTDWPFLYAALTEVAPLIVLVVVVAFVIGVILDAKGL